MSKRTSWSHSLGRSITSYGRNFCRRSPKSLRRSEVGEGAVHRPARTIQRKYFAPPEIGARMKSRKLLPCAKGPAWKVTDDGDGSDRIRCRGQAL
jgi:hypothetical protein